MIYRFAFAAVALTLLPAVGKSAIIVSVDMDSATPGIQNTIESAPGSTITAGLFMELTGQTTIATYNFSVQYDTSELSLVSRAETPSALTGLTELDASNPNQTNNGLLLRFDGTTFGNGPAAPFGPVRIGEVVFNALNPTGGAADIDITAGRFEPAFDLFFENNFNEVTNVTFVGGSVTTAIPEPSSILLLSLVGTCGAIYRRRRS